MRELGDQEGGRAEHRPRAERDRREPRAGASGRDHDLRPGAVAEVDRAVAEAALVGEIEVQPDPVGEELACRRPRPSARRRAGTRRPAPPRSRARRAAVRRSRGPDRRTPSARGRRRGRSDARPSSARSRPRRASRSTRPCPPLAGSRRSPGSPPARRSCPTSPMRRAPRTCDVRAASCRPAAGGRSRARGHPPRARPSRSSPVRRPRSRRERAIVPQISSAIRLLQVVGEGTRYPSSRSASWAGRLSATQCPPSISSGSIPRRSRATRRRNAGG